jgi:UDP-N-acetylmuramoyl-tripeptide--D-alanyl-D-alanine ligase
MSLPGKHVVLNALAAIATASLWGISDAEAQNVFPTLHTPSMRGELIRFTNGFALINDSYNSSPAALQAMIALLPQCLGSSAASLPPEKCAELGPSSKQLHRRRR